jgi:hypothetical protein
MARNEKYLPSAFLPLRPAVIRNDLGLPLLEHFSRVAIT